MKIVVPTMAHLPDHIAALETGWSPDTTRGAVAARETLAAGLRYRIELADAGLARGVAARA